MSRWRIAAPFHHPERENPEPDEPPERENPELEEPEELPKPDEKEDEDDRKLCRWIAAAAAAAAARIFADSAAFAC